MSQGSSQQKIQGGKGQILLTLSGQSLMKVFIRYCPRFRKQNKIQETEIGAVLPPATPLLSVLDEQYRIFVTISLVI